MPALPTAGPGEAVRQDAALQVTAELTFHMGRRRGAIGSVTAERVPRFEVRLADLLDLRAATAESEARDAIAKAASDGTAFSAVRDLKVETAKALRAKVDTLREEARRQLVASTEWAKDVAPYEHAKLKTQIEGDDKVLNVIIQKF